MPSAYITRRIMFPISCVDMLVSQLISFLFLYIKKFIGNNYRLLKLELNQKVIQNRFFLLNAYSIFVDKCYILAVIQIKKYYQITYTQFSKIIKGSLSPVQYRFPSSRHYCKYLYSNTFDSGQRRNRGSPVEFAAIPYEMFGKVQVCSETIFRKKVFQDLPRTL